MTLDDFEDIVYFHPARDRKLRNYGDIQKNVVQRADIIRGYAGVPVIVSSADRPRTANSKNRSRHLTAWGNQKRLCNALDLIPASIYDYEKLVMAALRSGPPALGVYENGSIHIDERPGEHARWCYLEGEYCAWNWENLVATIVAVQEKRGD